MGDKSEFSDVIIIGAGMSGLGCARRLHENGQKFKIITENIGGRVKTSPDGQVNYGAYYVRGDYTHLKPFLKYVRRLRFKDFHFHNGKEHYHAFSWRMIKHIPALCRLLFDLYVFRHKYYNLRDISSEHSRKDLIESDPMLREAYHQKAAIYIKKRGLEALNKEYLEQFLWASFFYDPHKVTTAIYLGSLLPIVVPFHSFVLQKDKMIEPFKDDVIIDSLTKVNRKNGMFELSTKSGKSFVCRKLVLAMPIDITNKFLKKPQKIKGGINVSYYHVNGKIRPQYHSHWFNMFSLKEKSATSEEVDGSFLYFYQGKDNIKKYFSEYKIITKDAWKPCLFFLGDEYVELDPEKNLFIATDHDVPSMEDAYINGMYTAKLVLDSEKK